MLWQSTITLKKSHPNKVNCECAINHGVTDTLAQFPLQFLVNLMTATISNNPVSQHMHDTLPIILRMVDPEEFSKHDSMTLAALDFLAYYEDAVKEARVPKRRDTTWRAPDVLLSCKCGKWPKRTGVTRRPPRQVYLLPK